MYFLIKKYRNSTDIPGGGEPPQATTVPTASIYGITDILNLDRRKFINSIVKINKELKWMDPSIRGYLSLDCRKNKIIASFNFIKELERINPEIISSQSFALHQDKLGLEKIKA